MSQEVKASLEDKSKREVADMCMKQMREVIDAIDEANVAITQRYVEKNNVMCGYNKLEQRDETIQDLDKELRKLYVVSHRAQQLEYMMKHLFDEKKEFD